MLNNLDHTLETLDELETDYVKILYYDIPKHFSGEYKSYHYPRFCTILSGQKKITLNNNKKFSYNKNKYLLLPSNTKVKMDIDVNTTALVFELNNDLITNVFNKTKFMEEEVANLQLTMDYFLGNNQFDISEDIQNMFYASKSKEYNKQFLIDLYAQKLVFDLIQNKASRYILNVNSHHPISLAVKSINENIGSMINIKELAKELHMSESNFSHLFKKYLGLSPMDYIKDKKLELALEYLRNENVTEVAYMLGYANISYFIKLFKEKFKMTPKQYQLTYYEKI